MSGPHRFLTKAPTTALHRSSGPRAESPMQQGMHPPQVQVFLAAPVPHGQVSLCQRNTVPNTFMGKQSLLAVTSDPGVNNTNFQNNALPPLSQPKSQKRNYKGILLRFQCPQKQPVMQASRGSRYLVGCLTDDLVYSPTFHPPSLPPLPLLS